MAEVRLALIGAGGSPPRLVADHTGRLNRVGDREESWGYRLTGLAPSQAAVGLALLPRLDEVNRQRRRNAERLMARLAGLDGVQPSRSRRRSRADLPSLAGACAG